MSITDPMIGRKLGDYTIQEMLGQGGMARVYKGYDEKLDRYAAVKVIDAHLVARETESEYRERFRREARAIARLNHPNIVKIYQFGEDGPLYYMAMELVSGRDLRQIIRDHTVKSDTMDYAEVMRVMNDITNALDYAHKEGVIHRDVKPSNIMVAPSGQSILMDFGLALSVPEGTLGSTFGSVHYIAPEQAVSSARAVPQSDLYSLGIVLYEMLTGRVPFDDQSTMSVALKHLSDPPPAPSSLNPMILPQIEEVVLKALDKEPRKRYANGQEFTRALDLAFGFNAPLNLDEQWGSNSSRPDFMFPRAPSTPTKPTGADPLHYNTTNKVKPILGTMDDSPTISEARRSRAFLSEEAKAHALDKSGEDPRDRLLMIGVIVAIVVLGGLGLIALINNFVSGQPTPTALAIAAATETEAVTQEVLAPTSTLRPTNTVLPTATPTDTLTDTPAATTTRRPTTTPRPTGTPTQAHTGTPTPTDTAERTQEPTVAVVVVPTQTPAPENPDVVLYYDHRTLVLVNRSEAAVDISDLYFIRTDAEGQENIFEANNWTNDGVLTNFRPQNCLQVWTNSFNFLEEDESVCSSRQGWRQLTSGRLFWISNEDEAIFEVRRGSRLLATCPASPSARTADFEFECGVSLSGDR